MNAKKTILMAEDDEDYYRLTEEALKESQVPAGLSWVDNGESCLDYLFMRGDYASPNSVMRPDLILLDLNMPRKGGHDTLQEIKAHPILSRIPVLIMTISTSPEDISKSYALGASSFITKPIAFNRLVDLIKTFNRYWFEFVSLPPQKK